MAPSCQELEPPGIPARFMSPMTHDPDWLTSPAKAEPMPDRPARVRISTSPYRQADRNGTHRELQALVPAQITQQSHFKAEVTRVRQQRTQARHRASTWDQLGKLDRYLRRALSRRSKAICAFDAMVATAAERSADPPLPETPYLGEMEKP